MDDVPAAVDGKTDAPAPSPSAVERDADEDLFSFDDRNGDEDRSTVSAAPATSPHAYTVRDGRVYDPDGTLFEPKGIFTFETTWGGAGAGAAVPSQTNAGQELAVAVEHVKALTAVAFPTSRRSEKAVAAARAWLEGLEA